MLQTHGAQITDLITARPQPTTRGDYLHWDQLRHREPPASVSLEQWWLGLKLARLPLQRRLPLKDVYGKPFSVVMTPRIQEALHEIDSLSTGRIAMPAQVRERDTRQRFLFRSLVEEAITSSQLEGAATTRKQALEMLLPAGNRPTRASG